MNDVAYSYNESDERYEIIGGHTHMMSSPGVNHVRVNGNLNSIFGNYLKGKSCEPFNQFNVFFSEKDHFIPDEIIVCDSGIVDEKGIYGTPDLVVEISSPSTARRDRMEKFAAYEKYGVKEYWIILPQEKRVEVYIRKDDKLVLDDVYSVYRDFELEDLTEEKKAKVKLEIKVSLYDDLYVKLEDIFDRVK